MASRYWVGGSGTWDAASTTHWSTASGGSGGASVPGPLDDVIFDFQSGTSSSTVVLGVSPVVGSLAFKTVGTGNYQGDFDMSGRTLSILKSFTISTAVDFDLLFDQDSEIRFVGTDDNAGAGWPITVGGALTGPDMPQITFDGEGGKWEMEGVLFLFASATLFFLAGHLVTNDFNVKAAGWSFGGSGTKNIELGASSVRLAIGSWLIGLTAANLTIDAGTSEILVVGDFSDFVGGGFEYHTVRLQGGGIQRLEGKNTFTGDLERTPPAVFNAETVITDDQTVQGTLIVNGVDPAHLVLVHGESVGLPQIIEAAATDLVNVQFQDIIALGDAAPFSGTYVGDGQGTFGIEFDAPRTLYRVAGGGDWSDSDHWSLSSGGTGGEDPPLVQDDAIFDDNTFSSDGDVVFLDSLHCARKFDCSAVDRPFTMQFPPIERAFYGDFILSPLMTMERIGESYVSLRDRSATAVINTNGCEVVSPVYVIAPGCSVHTLESEFEGTTLLLYAGAIDTAGNPVKLSELFSTSGFGAAGLDNPRWINFGASDIELSGTGTLWGVLNTEIVDAHLATIRFTDGSEENKLFGGGGESYGTIVLPPGGALIMSGANTIGIMTTEA